MNNADTAASALQVLCHPVATVTTSISGGAIQLDKNNKGAVTVVAAANADDGN